MSITSSDNSELFGLVNLRLCTKVMSGLGAIAMPGLVAWTNCAPPSFAPFVPLLLPFTAVVMLWGFYRVRNRPSMLPRAISAMLCVMLMLCIYALLLNYVTVAPPPGFDAERVQIGFGLAEFSLTPTAKNYLQQPTLEVNTSSDLMLHFGVWGDVNSIDRVWKWQCVVAAGLLLQFLFIASIGLWAYAMGIVNKFIQTMPEPRRKTCSSPVATI